jgi:hypothetical protein
MAIEPGQKLQPDSPQKNAEQNGLKKFGLFAVIVGDLMGYTGAGIGLGYLAWNKLGAPWWVLLITTLAGLSLAFYRVYQISQREL